MTPLGSHPTPTHVIAHLSDTHLLADGLLHGHIDTVGRFRATLERVKASRESVDVLVISGDLTDTADPRAYALFRQISEEAATEFGADLVLVGGNHDEREPLARVLFDEETDAPQDRVTTVRGLRIIAMDSALPGRHDGGFDDRQYAWLSRELSKPAPAGTILVMHHPPIVYRSPLMQLLDFEDASRLSTVLAGSDVRMILSGHLHVSSFGVLPGTSIPVVVAGGVSYVDDVGAPRDLLMAVDGAQSWNLVEVHPDQVVATVAPAAQLETWPSLAPEVTAYLAELPPEEQRTAFATKR